MALAIRDALATFAADEIIVAIRSEGDAGIVEAMATKNAPHTSVEGVPVRFELSAGEYRTVRAHDRRFLVFPEPWHTSPEVETVVERQDRFWVVEKHGAAGDEAEHLAEEGPSLL